MCIFKAKTIKIVVEANLATRTTLLNAAGLKQSELTN